MVASTKKKAAFLDEVTRALNLPASVHPVRIEEFVPTFGSRSDIVTARALAPMPALLSLAAPLLKSGAKALLPKGQDVEAELTEAAKYWKIEADLVASRTKPAGRIVVVRALQPLAKGT